MRPAIFMLPLLLTITALASPKTAPAKLWVTDFAAYINENPQRSCIVAHNQQPALSSEEAQRFARADAADQLLPLLQRFGPNVAPPKLRRTIEFALQQPGWILDRHVESNERSYGTTWTESLLIDTSTPRLEQLARQLSAIARHEKQQKAAIFVISAVLFIIVSFAYLAANWLTRGYFRGRLAFASIAILIAGITALTHLV